MEACQGLANDLASDNWPLTVGNGGGGGDHHHHHLEHGAGGDGACHEEEGHLGQGGATCSVCKEVEECSGVQDCFCELTPVMWGEGEPAITKFLELPQHTTDFLSSVPPVRPLVELPFLPKFQRKDKTLVLDLDQTLVHSTLTTMNQPDYTMEINVPESGLHTVYVKLRPYLLQFLKFASSLFEVVVFTASPTVYANRVLDRLDPHHELIDHRMFRHHCHHHHHHKAHYIKDLCALGRDLSKVAIIDNSVEAFAFQLDNGVLIEDFLGSREDTALLRMQEFLVKLAKAKDARQAVHDYYDQL